jgi:hypothetical protein
LLEADVVAVVGKEHEGGDTVSGSITVTSCVILVFW